MKDTLFYEYDENSINEVVDEAEGTGNFIAMRRVRWSPTSEFKYDIRKYFTRSDGTEIAGKGFAFMSEKGPDTLAEVLVGNGFGDTDNLVNLLSGRGNEFMMALARATANNADFYHELDECYREVEEEENNKPLNAKDMLGQLLL